jgi:hypothetical protein
MNKRVTTMTGVHDQTWDSFSLCMYKIKARFGIRFASTDQPQEKILK